MSEKPNTQGKQELVQSEPLSWEAIGKLSKSEYLARRDEIVEWMKKHISSGRAVGK